MRWAYHLTTLGSVLLLTALVMLLVAAVATIGGDAFDYAPPAGTIVTPHPVPNPPPAP